MSFNTGHLFARVLVPSLLLIGSAQAGDASFLPSDTISVQGVPNVADDFTIECRLWIPSSSSPIMGSWSGIPGGSVFHAQRDSAMDTSLYAGPDGIYVMGPTYSPYITGIAFALPKNQWCHVAVVRKGSSIKAYLNGTQAGSITCSSARNALVTNADVRIGAPVHNGSGLIDKGFTGRIDWLRVSSVARYTANFNVPTEDSLIPADASTELLLRFNEAPGASQVRDDSPHHFASVVGDPSKFPSGTATAPRFPGPAVCPSDLDGNGEVDVSDISLLLLDFGPCP